MSMAAPSGSLNRRPKQVLVVVTRRIGDVLLATPLIRSLKRAWPGARIDALVFSGTQDVLLGNADIDQIHTVPERPSITNHVALLRRLFRRYDLALSLIPGDRPTLYAWLAGRHSIGLQIDQPDQRWKQRLLSQWTPLDPFNMHTVRTYLSLADAIGVPAVSDVVVSWRPEDAAAVDVLLGSASIPVVVLHPYPKFRYKMWHEQGWVAIARWLMDNGFRVVLTGGRDPVERAYIGAIAQQLPETVLDLSGHLALGGVASLLTRARLFVGPDTAITHMAAAAGVPTLALFGPSDPVRWGPWPRGHGPESNPWLRLGNQRSGNVQLMQGLAACVPCGHEGCARHVDSDSDCLLAIAAKSVIDRLRTMIDGG